jgi:hypothetical protein
MPTFKVLGQMCHLAVNFLPHRPVDHKCLQMYFIADPDNTRAEPERIASIRINKYINIISI